MCVCVCASVCIIGRENGNCQVHVSVYACTGTSLIYMYIYMYIYTYTHIYTCTYIYIHIHTYTYIYIDRYTIYAYISLWTLSTTTTTQEVAVSANINKCTVFHNQSNKMSQGLTAMVVVSQWGAHVLYMSSRGTPTLSKSRSTFVRRVAANTEPSRGGGRTGWLPLVRLTQRAPTRPCSVRRRRTS